MQKEIFKSKTSGGHIAHTIVELRTIKGKKMVSVTQKILLPIDDYVDKGYFPLHKINSRNIFGRAVFMNQMIFWDSSFRSIVKAYKSFK